MDSKTIFEIERIIGYTFKNKALLNRCFVHSSYTNEHKNVENNERLEFLGDAVLELIFSEKLYKEGSDEGTMTDKRQRCVSDVSLSAAVKKLGLDKYLICGGSSYIGKKAIPSLLEAIAAGIYLDGGYEEAKRFVLSNVEYKGGINYVGKLQEFMQSKGKPLPVYECINKSGEDNSPVFTIKASADGGSCSAEGDSKKRARMAAAEALYLKLSNRNK